MTWRVNIIGYRRRRQQYKWAACHNFSSINILAKLYFDGYILLVALLVCGWPNLMLSKCRKEN